MHQVYVLPITSLCAEAAHIGLSHECFLFSIEFLQPDVMSYYSTTFIIVLILLLG